MFKDNIALMQNPRIVEFLFLVSECIVFICCTMFFLIMLWWYVPYGNGAKIMLSFVSVTIYYDIFKHFVHTKWILLKNKK